MMLEKWVVTILAIFVLLLLGGWGLHQSMESSKNAIRKFFAEHPNEEYSGRQIRIAAKIFGGNLYSALLQLEDAGEIQGRWADEPYPRRRLYRAKKDV